MGVSQWLIEGGYICIFSVHFLMLLITSLAALLIIVKRWEVFDWLALSSLFMAFGFLLSTQTFFQAHVYNDEFYYAAIAQNIADRGVVCPLVYESTAEQPKSYTYFQPPYPQGWPCLIGIFSKFMGYWQFRAASMPMWYCGTLLNKLLLMGSLAGLFVALRCLGTRIGAWFVCMSLVFLPLVGGLAQGASAEPASLSALVITFLACAALKLLPRKLGYLWLTLSAAFLVQMRPEGAVALVLALVVGAAVLIKSKEYRQLPWLTLGGCAAVWTLFSWPAIWAVFDHPPQLNHHFEALARPGLTIWQNRAFNVINNLYFFIKNQGWPVALTVSAVVFFCLKPTAEEAENNFSQKSLTGWAAVLWLSLFTLFLAWYPFGDYASVYSYDSWRFAYVVVVPMSFLASAGFGRLCSRGGAFRWAAGLLLLASFTPYLWRASVVKLNPMQNDYDRFMFQAVQTAASSNVPLVVPDTHLFCDAAYRWGGRVYTEERLLALAGLPTAIALKSDELLAAPFWPKNTEIMVACLYKSSDNMYNLELWEGWDITLLAEEAHIKAGLFLFKKNN
ncbi:MAG: hypothetical protein ACI38Q_05510 [Candidatus Bruticola sp.]